MTIVEAISILDLNTETTITSEIVKKQFRKLAHTCHPDKYELETDKLKKTKLFIQIKEAYDSLNNYILANGPYINAINSEFNSPTLEQIGEPVPSTIYAKQKSKRSLEEVIGIFSLPFGLLALLFVGCFMILYYMAKEAIEESKKSGFGVFKLFLMLIFQLIPMLFAGYWGLVLLWSWATDQNSWIAWITIAQSGLLIGIWIWSYAMRKYLENKYNLRFELKRIND